MSGYTTDNHDRIQVPGFFTIATADGREATIAVAAVRVVEEHPAKDGQANAQILLADGASCETHETREQVMRLIHKALAFK